jgi:hypothetical protein
MTDCAAGSEIGDEVPLFALQPLIFLDPHLFGAPRTGFR